MVADEEFKLDLGSKAVALHVDDQKLKKRQSQLGERSVLTYGESGAVHWAGGDDLCLGGERTETIKVKPKVIGDHSRLALLAAATVGVMLDLTVDEIRNGIDEFVPVSGRMQLLKGKNGVTIIDDSYNSSPDAALAALATLRQTAKGRKIALLGQMNELGSYSQEAHEMVGKVAGKLDIVLTLGNDANNYLGAAAVKSGLDKANLHAFKSPYEAGEWLSKAVKKGDTILVKGSQNGVFAEESIKPILADPADSAKLVRQSPDWLARKAEQFGVK
jgi:UDP-N-acetylmuramoyl-tripeptide--D-alanyl-D-alanine ligase